MRRINKFAEWFTKYMVVWVVGAVGLAYFFPSAFVPLKPFMELFFACTMFGIGALLTPRPQYQMPYLQPGA